MFESFPVKLTLSGQTSEHAAQRSISSSTILLQKNIAAQIFKLGQLVPMEVGGVCVTIRGGTDTMTSSVEIRMGGGGGEQSLSEDWGQSKVMQK